MIKIGEQIPDLEVQAFHQDDVRRVRLSDYRGSMAGVAVLSGGLHVHLPD
jgi:hypothetical protein